MDERLHKLTALTSENERDRYSIAILALLRRVQVSEGDMVIKSELAPLYDLLETLKSASVTESELTNNKE